MSYAKALKKTTTEYAGKSTVIATIKNIDITLEELATKLKDQTLYDLVEGIQISHNKKFVEVIIHHEEAKQFLVSEGINFGNTLITFRPEVPITVNVSLFNVPLEMPDDILYSYLERYGEILFQSQKTYHRKSHRDRNKSGSV